MADRFVLDGMPKPVRAVAYVRVSMARENMISPELQLLAVFDYCKRRGYVICATLQDLDLSGRFWQRRQVEQAIAMIEGDQADVLVVWRWSRVTRNRLDWAVAVDRVESVGGRLESATEAFDTTTATGRFARGMLAEFAAFESERMGDVWREVRDRRARIGLPTTGHQQFGYRKTGGRYVPDRRTGPILAQLYRRYSAGESHRSLADWLNGQRLNTASRHKNRTPWSHTTLARMMDRGFAAGIILARGTPMPGAHKPLITDDEWQAYLARRAATSWRKQTPPDTFLLTGMLHCRCGATMAPVPTSDPTRFKAKYRCRNHPPTLAGGSVVQHRLDPLVRDWLAYLAGNADAQADARRGSRAFAAQQWDEVRRLQRRLAAPNADPPGQAPLEQALAAAEAASAWRDPVELAQTLLEDWDTLTIGHRRRRLHALIRKVTVHNQYSAPVIVLDTTWGLSCRYTGVPRPTLPPAASPALNNAAPPVAAPATPPDHTQMLAPHEAAKLVGVTTTTLCEWRRAGMLPASTYIGAGRGYVYSAADLRSIVSAPRRAHGVDHQVVLERVDLS